MSRHTTNNPKETTWRTAVREHHGSVELFPVFIDCELLFVDWRVRHDLVFPGVMNHQFALHVLKDGRVTSGFRNGHLDGPLRSVRCFDGNDAERFLPDFGNCLRNRREVVKQVLSPCGDTNSRPQ